MPRTGVTPQVLRFLQERPGRPITLEEVADKTGFAARQIQTASWRIIKDNMLPGLSVVTSGHVWRYDENAESVLAHDLLLTLLRELDDKTALYLDDTNGIYKVVKIG